MSTSSDPKLPRKPRRSSTTVTVIEVNQPDPVIFGKALHQFLKDCAADRRAAAQQALAAERTEGTS